ncbi:MAG TPA: amino acid adenylation domain-containing protein, partial [Polyangiaceae bacterium]
ALARACALASAPFEIASDVLLRVALYRIGRDRHVLAVCLHHLITDAWSIGILFHELIQLYDLFRNGASPSPPPDGPGYVDFAHWQRLAFGEAEQNAQLAYWLKQLDGAPVLELPTDHPRSAVRSSRGALLPLSLSAELLDAVHALATEQGVTPFMVMLAAFELLLHRYTNQWDVVIGVPIAGRHRLASEPLIGTLVNTLALRLSAEPSWSFRELLARVRDVSLEAHAHQDLPFERLVSELNLERLPGRSPLVDVMFDYQNTPMPAGRSETLSFEPVFLSRGAAQFDLSLLVMDTAFGRTAAVEYRTDLFEGATIERLLEHYAAILSSVVSEPDGELARIPLLSAQERAEIVLLGRASARPEQPRYAPVHQLFAAQAAQRPEVQAVADASGSFSYGELDRRSSVLANELAQAGAGPGARVAIYVGRSRDMLTALLAVLKSGAAYVPLDPLYPPARREFVLADCKPEILLTERALRASLPAGYAGRAIDLDAEREGESLAALTPNAASDPGAPAYVLYTSGSTGQPKGVEISHGALTNFLQSMAHAPGIGPHDRLLAITTLAFDIAGLELFLPLVAGACLHIASSDVTADGRRLRELIERTAPSIVQATPSTWRLLLEAGFQGHGALTVLCGGEAMDRELAEALLDRAARVWNMYGPTETTIWSTAHRVERGSGPVSIGKPIDGTRVYILDERRELVPLGVPGEIYIAGAGVANGYFGRADLTVERFSPDPFVTDPGARMYGTGDRGSLRKGGNFYCLGRLDQQLKIRGYRIEPGEIESALKELAGVQDAVVIARQDRPGDVRLVAYYVAASATEPLTLRAALQQTLPEYMVPSHFVRLPGLPQTPNGKIDRAALPPPGAGSEASSVSRAPRDALESALATIWCDVLHRGRAGVHDNFFDSGGHSLLAVRLFARIENELGAALSLSAFVQSPTIGALARQIRAQRRGAPASERSFAHLVVVQAAGAGEPLFCVHGAGGNVLNMPGIARHLRKDRPFYAFKARGADGRGAPCETIEEMAAAYLHDLREVQPHGPYFLSGYCGGGIVAYEMARQLVSAGERVALCALIDTYCPTIETSAERVAQLKRGVVQQGARYLAQRARARLSRDALAISRDARIRYHLTRGNLVPLALRDFWLTTAFFRAASRYIPRRYRGTLTIFRAEEVQPLLCHVGDELGWADLVEGGVETHRIPGNHDELSLEPNVAGLAETLQRCVDAAARFSRPPSFGPPRE